VFLILHSWLRVHGVPAQDQRRPGSAPRLVAKIADLGTALCLLPGQPADHTQPGQLWINPQDAAAAAATTAAAGSREGSRPQTATRRRSSNLRDSIRADAGSGAAGGRVPRVEVSKDGLGCRLDGLPLALVKEPTGTSGYALCCPSPATIPIRAPLPFSSAPRSVAHTPPIPPPSFLPCPRTIPINTTPSR